MKKGYNQLKKKGMLKIKSELFLGKAGKRNGETHGVTAVTIFFSGSKI